MSAVVDCNEYGEPVRDEYRRLGAGSIDESDVGMFVRFEPGFGLNVHVGRRLAKRRTGSPLWERSTKREDQDLMVLGLDGWRRLCELVDEWRARAAADLPVQGEPSA